MPEGRIFNLPRPGANPILSYRVRYDVPIDVGERFESQEMRDNIADNLLENTGRLGRGITNNIRAIQVDPAGSVIAIEVALKRDEITPQILEDLNSVLDEAASQFFNNEGKRITGDIDMPPWEIRAR